MFDGAKSHADVYVDVYVVGPPCVKFSHLGRREGESIADNSTFAAATRRILRSRPLVCVLENVLGLISIEGGDTFKSLLERLRDNGSYCITWHVFNSRDYRVPQPRRRVYVIRTRAGIARDAPVFDGDKLAVSLSEVF